jgi:peroxiredoxin
VELQRDVRQLDERGIKLVTISYDSEEILRGFTERNNITFTMLSDPASEVIERFDLLNPVPTWIAEEGGVTPEIEQAVSTYVSVVGPNPEWAGIAFPGTFILDSDGGVLERDFEDFYIERNTISSILLRRGEDLTPVEATRVSTPQFDLTTFPSSSELAPGNRFTLVLNVEPAEGMHIYAPGADNYRVIALDIEAQPFIETLPMEYPESASYYFEPFDETVPVYEEPFTLLQEVVLKGDLESQGMLRGRDSVTISGTLEYQACDAEICYVPASVPLSWTMSLRPLVFR